MRLSTFSRKVESASAARLLRLSTRLWTPLGGTHTPAQAMRLACYRVVMYELDWRGRHRPPWK